MAASEREELAAIAADLRGHLEWLRESGTSTLPAPPKPQAAQACPAAGSGADADGAPASRASSLRAAVRASVGASRPPAASMAGAGARASTPFVQRAAAPSREPAPQPAAGASSGPASPATASGGAGGPRTLEQIRQELGECQRCKLGQGRTRLVFGVGNPKAELVFVGEGPGADEDQQGIPFVGAAGELLTKMIQAMGYGRDEVYICNVVKCRPPGNRNPEPDEIAACEPFLKAQLASMHPKVIVALGKCAAQTLLRDPTPITRLRGSWREYCGIRLMPTFHPAYLLRSPAEKRKVWEDLKLVMKLLGKEPASSK